MLPTTPNKEIVRRISILFNAKYCYLRMISEDSHIYILTDIADTDISNYESELQAWCGMTFQVHNESDKKNIINDIIDKGEKILPIKSLEIKKAEKKLGL